MKKKKAVFIDFYGTLVHEDGEIIAKITREIMETGKADSAGEIGSFWWDEFRALFTDSYGDTFRTQRELEKLSLERTIRRFESSADADSLSEMLFAHWIKPPAFPDAAEFMEKCPLPVYIVSNIDTADIMKAVKYSGFEPAGIYTSEDARAYKPRPELFEHALRMSGKERGDVIHIGDSLSSDIKGAAAAGIDAVWINREGKTAPDGVYAVGSLTEMLDGERL